MSLFNKMFGGDSQAKTAQQSNSTGQTATSVSKAINFGRYTDCNKNKAQVQKWNEAVEKFKAKAYVDSFEAFLYYIRDEEADNVQIKRNGELVEFEFVQGSKIIRGKGDAERFVAEANICLMDQPSIPVMRKLMNINYNLVYTKFALTGNKLCMKFSSHTIDASPNKLYAALKELAKKADQQDDLLTQEFSSLQSIDTEKIIALSPEQKEIRYNYLMKMIQDCKQKINGYQDPAYMSGGIAFLLLNLTYQIDYLIVPQGTLTDALERIQRMFFAKNDLSTQQRNQQIIEEYDKIMSWSKEEVMDGIYDVKCTFALANPAAHKTVMDFMFKEREKVGWYRDNGYPEIVEAVYGYMLSYAYFNYGMVFPITDMMNIAMEVLHPEYYTQWGSKRALTNGDTLNSQNIIKEINNCLNAAKAEYPYVGMNTAALNFTNKTSFIDSLIVETDRFNLAKN